MVRYCSINWIIPIWVVSRWRLTQPLAQLLDSRGFPITENPNHPIAMLYDLIHSSESSTHDLSESIHYQAIINHQSLIHYQIVVTWFCLSVQRVWPFAATRSLAKTRHTPCFAVDRRSYTSNTHIMPATFRMVAALELHSNSISCSIQSRHYQSSIHLSTHLVGIMIINPSHPTSPHAVQFLNLNSYLRVCGPQQVTHLLVDDG